MKTKSWVKRFSGTKSWVKGFFFYFLGNEEKWKKLLIDENDPFVISMSLVGTKK